MELRAIFVDAQRFHLRLPKGIHPSILRPLAKMTLSHSSSSIGRPRVPIDRPHLLYLSPLPLTTHQIKRILQQSLRDELYHFVQGNTDSEWAFAVFLNQV